MKVPCVYIGPFKMIQGNLAIIRSVTLVTSGKSLWAYIATYPRVLENWGVDIFGDVFLPPIWKESRKMPPNGADHIVPPHPPSPVLSCKILLLTRSLSLNSCQLSLGKVGNERLLDFSKKIDFVPAMRRTR